MVRASRYIFVYSSDGYVGWGAFPVNSRATLREPLVEHVVQARIVGFQVNSRAKLKLEGADQTQLVLRVTRNFPPPDVDLDASIALDASAVES